MKTLLFSLFTVFYVGSISATDISFVGDFIEVFKFSQNGFFNHSGGCSDCSGIAETTCPKHSDRMISSNIKYGILGYFNNESKYERCTKDLGVLNQKDKDQFVLQLQRADDRYFLPSDRSYKKCMEKYDLEKGRSSKQQEVLLGMIEAYEIYNRINIDHHKRRQWKRVKLLEQLEKSDRQKKSLADAREEYRDLVEMDSCYTSDINCFGASWTFRSVPFYTFDEVKNENAKLSSETRKYLEAAACLER